MLESVYWDAKPLVEGVLESRKAKTTLRGAKNACDEYDVSLSLSCSTNESPKYLAPEKFEISCGSLYEAINTVTTSSSKTDPGGLVSLPVLDNEALKSILMQSKKNKTMVTATR